MIRNVLVIIVLSAAWVSAYSQCDLLRDFKQGLFNPDCPSDSALLGRYHQLKSMVYQEQWIKACRMVDNLLTDFESEGGAMESEDLMLLKFGTLKIAFALTNQSLDYDRRRRYQHDLYLMICDDESLLLQDIQRYIALHYSSNCSDVLAYFDYYLSHTTTAFCKTSRADTLLMHLFVKNNNKALLANSLRTSDHGPLIEGMDTPLHVEVQFYKHRMIVFDQWHDPVDLHNPDLYASDTLVIYDYFPLAQYLEPVFIQYHELDEAQPSYQALIGKTVLNQMILN